MDKEDYVAQKKKEDYKKDKNDSNKKQFTKLFIGLIFIK